ncbi:GTP cyclohydrolase [Micromonospora craterilacus]|uniref:GTP cyclohydrolase II n=1 Tax=Micromonospora craterilacus TaxID=1655439 RepID=A0A2W2F9F3_9ACTN|nr:GTP cyclohydrolase II [Micromonospora craterilacus]PZG22140.1 GTP cyclohydrolase [Micromonospora craterilacus]
MTATVRLAGCDLPTAHGQFQLHVFGPEAGPEEVLAAVHRPQPTDGQTPLVRMHSACATGDLLGSLTCDCGPQLATSLHLIGTSDYGILLYMLRHEGRGIGLAAKIRAYTLMDQGYDTVAANAAVGAPADARDYRPAADALTWLGVASVHLATNNPGKIDAFRAAGIAVDRVPLSGFVTPANRDYLHQKDTLLGHLNSSGAAAAY